MATILRGSDGFDSSIIRTESTAPAITTNATVGTTWIDSSSGEIYVCTDATTDNNVWKGAKGGLVSPVVRFVQNNYVVSGITPTQDNNIPDTIGTGLTGPSNTYAKEQQASGYYIGWIPGSGYGGQRYAVSFGTHDVTNFSTLKITTASYSNTSGSGAENWTFGVVGTSYPSNGAWRQHISSETNHSEQEFTLDISGQTGEMIVFAAVYYEELRITDFRMEA